MRIGYYGGSFNPPHLGHLNVARYAVDMLCLDELLLAPAGYQYFKSQDNVANKESRLEMCYLLTDRLEKKTFVYTGDVEREGPTYTITSVKEITKHFQNEDDELYLIIGLDSFEDFCKWYKVDEIVDLVTVAVFQRSFNCNISNYETAKFNLERKLNKQFKSLYIETPTIMDTYFHFKDEEYDRTIDRLSSSQIRELIKDKKPYEYLLTPEIAKYIKEHHLYGA